jgi:fumarylacetoacetase
MPSLIDQTHDSSLVSWVESANGHPDFPVQNLPLGVFEPESGNPRMGVAIGDRILDLRAVVDARLLPDFLTRVFEADALNAFFALPASRRREARGHISRLLSDPANRNGVRDFLHDAAACELLLPARIGDYTDFYTGIHHAKNVGRLFRPDDPLLPNYKYVPIGYHGRASSVRPSDVPVRRPNGQRKSPGSAAPSFGPCDRLDYELELGVWVGSGNELGEPIPITRAGDHVAGVCLLNDWSARDVQAWEYQPLGPFLAKSFHSTVSPWVVTAEALAPFRVAQPVRPDGDPAPLPYLFDETDQEAGSYSISLEVFLSSERMRTDGLQPHRLSRAECSNMYWTIAQMIAHHSSNGCNLQPGDLLGTGTISAPHDTGLGSLLELTRGGSAPIELPSGENRTFLLDGDEVELRGYATAAGRVQIGFGPCRARITPAYP